MKPAFLDTNIIIRYLTNEYPEKVQACYLLFKKVEENKITLITSESVIAEAVFVLSSPKLYDLPPEEIKKRLAPLLSLRGLKLDHRSTLIRALDLYTTHKIDFEDCLSVAHMEQRQLKDIYSYDRDFDRVTNVNRLEPSTRGGRGSKNSHKDQD